MFKTYGYPDFNQVAAKPQAAAAAASPAISRTKSVYIKDTNAPPQSQQTPAAGAQAASTPAATSSADPKQSVVAVESNKGSACCTIF